MEWLKKYWTALVAIGFLIAVLDVTFSSLATCHPPAHQSSQATVNQKAPEECSALKGPVLVSLVAIADATHKYEGLITAVFTVVLAGFTAALWRSTDKLWAAGEKQLALNKQVAEIAEKQFSISAMQTDIQTKQHHIGRLQFLADKRPRLKIRHVILEAIDRGSPFAKNQPMKGSLVVVNVGGTKAKFVWGKYNFYATNAALPMAAPIDEKLSPSLHAPGDVEIAGGESCAFQIESVGVLAGDNAYFIANGIDRWTIYIMGYIKYADEVGVERFLGFCRRYVPAPDEIGGGGRFVPVDNPDYEYED